jgi:phenylacetate-coenzyme A ligase PaaK-like adenylate-forming protein
VEILDEDGRSVSPGETGRIVVTNLGRLLSPVVRYPVGDLGRWVIAPGRLGRGGAFRLEERSHLSTKLSFWVVAHRDVLAEVEKVPGLSSVVQLIASRVNGVDWLTVRVAPLVSGEALQRARLALAARLHAAFPAFGAPPGSEQRPVLVVELCPPEEMIMTAAGKIKPIVEERSA